jgi:ATP-dependent Zn protease
MKSITDEAYEEAKRLLTEDYDALIALSRALLERETLDREEVIRVTNITPEKQNLPRLKDIARKGPHPGVS